MAFVKPESFLDGLVDIWAVDERGFPCTLYEHLHYQKRIVGSKRAYDAMAAGHTVSRVIWVPVRSMADDRAHIAVIDGKQYHVLQLQELHDKFPALCQLTLEASAALWERDREVGLVSATYTYDELKQRIPTETVKPVRGTVRYIRSAEAAVGLGLDGLMGEITLAVPAAVYEGQAAVMLDGRRYTVASTYRANDMVELILEERAGDYGN